MIWIKGTCYLRHWLTDSHERHYTAITCSALIDSYIVGSPSRISKIAPNIISCREKMIFPVQSHQRENFYTADLDWSSEIPSDELIFHVDERRRRGSLVDDRETEFDNTP
jgi:hypothetical protein